MAILKRRKLDNVVWDTPDEEEKIVRPCFENLWGGFLLNVPDWCPSRIVIDTNDTLEIPAADVALCRICPEQEGCPSWKWLMETSKTRIRICTRGE